MRKLGGAARVQAHRKVNKPMLPPDRAWRMDIGKLGRETGANLCKYLACNDFGLAFQSRLRLGTRHASLVLPLELSSSTTVEDISYEGAAC